MNSKLKKYKSLLLRKSATLLLIAASTFVAFASLGDGKTKDKDKKNILLSPKKSFTSIKDFTLKSNYQFRGSQIINEQNDEPFIMLNTNITVQKGNTTYIMPLKKKVILEKVKFTLNQYNSRY